MLLYKSVFQKSMNRVITSHKKMIVKKVKNQHVLNGTYGHSGNDYIVTTLSESYPTTT